MRAQCSIPIKIWHPSHTLRTKKLQNVSAVLKLEAYLATLSHFTEPGAPESKRCAQFWKEKTSTALALYGPRSSRMRALCSFLKRN